MWKPRLLLASLALGWIALASRGLGHGGTIPPPPPPPDLRLTAVKNANSPGPGNPGSPGPTVKGGTTGGIRGASGPTTGRRGSAETLDRWEFWWEANKDGYLVLRDDAPTTTASAGFAGRVHAAPPTRRVASAEVRARILPALLAALSDPEAEVVDSAALALGRSVKPDEAMLAFTPLVRTLDHPGRTAREAAVLALGVVGSADATSTLRELLLDSDEGRRLTAHPAGVEEQVRAFAAAALGLIGDPAAIEDLERCLEPAIAGASRSLSQLALLSLGNVRGDATGVVAFLIKAMSRREIDPIVRAHAPIALARLAATPEGLSAARSALGTLVNALASDKTEADLRRSVAVALGRLASIEDAEALAALKTLVLRGADGPARQFALIALAEIGARDAEARRHGPLHAELEQFLLRQLVDPARASLKPFAALALGIWGRSEAALPDARERVTVKLLDHFDSERDSSNRAAIALSLGLLDAREAVAPLALAFADAGDPSFKGYVALSLGLLRARERSELLRSELERPALAPLFETQLALALGLMGDPRAVPTLVARLSRADTFAEVSSDAQALGLIGDESAVEPLVLLLGDAKAPAARRGVAAVALGLLARKGDLPWNEPFRAASNYCARSVALAEIADLL